MLSAVDAYKAACGEQGLKPQPFVVSQLERAERRPASLDLSSNSSARLGPGDVVRPCLRAQFAPLVPVATRMCLLRELNIAGQRVGDKIFIGLLGALKQAGCALQSLDCADNELSCLSGLLATDLCADCERLSMGRNALGDCFLD